MGNRITAIIIDDEIGAIDNLKKLLNIYCHDIDILTAQDTALGQTLIVEHNPDVVFLDIEMPNESGIEFIKRIAPVSFELVFITAYDEYAIKTFQLNALDYILKPIDINYFKESMNRLAKRIENKIIRPDLIKSERINNYLKNGEQKHIVLPFKGDFEYVQFNDVISVEAQGAYSLFNLHTKRKDSKIMTSHNLAYYEILLPPDQFIRVHRGYIINLNHVISFKLNSPLKLLLLTDSSQIPVSRRKVAALKAYLKNG